MCIAAAVCCALSLLVRAAQVRLHLWSVCPPYANCSVSRLGGGAFAWNNPRDTPGNRAAARVLEQVMGKPPKYYR